MEKLIDFSDPCLRTFLPVLLQDHTTGKNIIWATDPPPELGVGFTDEITLEQLDKVQLVPRVQKRLADQKKRTSKKAEVFTPSCGSCKWYAEPEGVCVNDQSEHVADFVWDERGCKEWEKRENDN